MKKVLKLLLHHATIFSSYLLLPLSLALYLFRFRAIEHGFVIGSLCTQLGAYAREKKLGRIPNYRLVLFSATNTYFCKLWKDHFFVISPPWLKILLRPFFSLPFMKLERPYFSDFPNSSFFAVNQIFEEKFPKEKAILKFPEKDTKKSWDLLRQFGIEQNDWFVCFYTRQPGEYSSVDFETQGRVRNVDVKTYKKALWAILERGGWCIRVGSSKMESLPKELLHPKIIDYPKTALASEFMDCFLLSHCRFMLTCSSGISMIPGLFGIPILMTNVIPLHIAIPLYSHDISILKRYFSTLEKRELSFREALCMYMTDQVSSYYYDSLSLQVLDNTEEEILEATQELLLKMENSYEEPADYQTLQERFKDLIPNHLFCKNGTGNLGYHFLKKYEHLLLNEPCEIGL